MDIRQPKPIHGWLDFVKEVGIIVLGVSIALAAEQGVERWRENRQYREARSAIRDELNLNIMNIKRRGDWAPCTARRLDEVGALLDRAENRQPFKTPTGSAEPSRCACAFPPRKPRPHNLGGTPAADPEDSAAPKAVAYAGTFDRAQPVFGGQNEVVLRHAAGPQIVPLYGALCRSTPVFFLTDDHDYFDNDEATDEAVTFPPDSFMLNLARATRQLYYPEFLPDSNRPPGLPGASAGDRAPGVGEVFGTLRYGRLVELLLYDVRRTMTMAGPTAVFVDGTAESWLKARMASREVAHVVNIPSNPPGWSAGKWMEWYPDILGSDGKLTTTKAKPYWQEGWLRQHDRLMAAIAAMPGRIPLIVSGDLHAIAEGRMHRSGILDFSNNPIVTVLSGPLGTGDMLWPSAFRGVGASPPMHLTMEENLKPIEENGFIIADFTPETITLKYFRFNYYRQSPDEIDALEPFRVTELKRPA